MQLRNQRRQITLADRFAAAVLSVIAAFFTLVAYFFIGVKLSAKSAFGAEFIWSAAFSKGWLSIMVGAYILGFLLGSERLAEMFSIFWGTHDLWKRSEFQILVAMLVVLVAVIYFFKSGRLE